MAISTRLLHIKLISSPLLKNFSTDRSAWISVLGDPKIQSPFNSSHRIDVSSVKSATNISKISKDVKKLVKDNVVFSSDVKSTSSESVTSFSAGPTCALPPKSPHNSNNESTFTRVSKSLGLYIDSSLPESEQKILRTSRNTKIGCFFVFGGLGIGFVWFCVTNAVPKRDEKGQVIKDQYSGSWLAPFHRIMDAVYSCKSFMTEPSRDKLLPDPLRYPYHQPKYTVVIEMKNVLLNPEWTYKTGYRFKKRPAVEYFLEVVGYPNFELVLYTSESPFTAAPIVESLDPKQRILYKLYRDCTKFMNGHHVKDLSRLNRDLSKVIYIDFDPNAFQLNPDNVLRVRKWEGDMTDTGLVDLAELLKTIFLSDVDDVRPILQYYSQFDDPAAEFRRRASMIEEQKKQEESQKKDSQLRRLSSGSIFGFRRHANA